MATIAATTMATAAATEYAFVATTVAAAACTAAGAAAAATTAAALAAAAVIDFDLLSIPSFSWFRTSAWHAKSPELSTHIATVDKTNRAPHICPKSTVCTELKANSSNPLSTTGN